MKYEIINKIKCPNHDYYENFVETGDPARMRIKNEFYEFYKDKIPVLHFNNIVEGQVVSINEEIGTNDTMTLRLFNPEAFDYSSVHFLKIKIHHLEWIDKTELY